MYALELSERSRKKLLKTRMKATIVLTLLMKDYPQDYAGKYGKYVKSLRYKLLIHRFYKKLLKDPGSISMLEQERETCNDFESYVKRHFRKGENK